MAFVWAILGTVQAAFVHVGLKKPQDPFSSTNLRFHLQGHLITSMI